MPKVHFHLSYKSKSDTYDPLVLFKDSLVRGFYKTDPYIRGDKSDLEIVIKKTDVGTGSIFESSINGSCILGSTRNFHDIRRDHADILLIWLPVIGKVGITQNNHHEELSAGNIALTYSQLPFRVETVPDENNRHLSYQVTVPYTSLASFIPEVELLCGTKLPVAKGSSTVALKIFQTLFENAEQMSENTLALSFEAALKAVADAFKPSCDKLIEKTDGKRMRLKQIMDYMASHSSDADLTAERAATACGISTRYLHILFKTQFDKSFRDHRWEQRLVLANSWLTNDAFDRLQISQIASKVGFRSAAHFCRSFKQHFGCTPTEARRNHLHY